MKRLLASAGLTLTLCALACAQESTGDRVVVPARNTTRPRVVDAAATNGPILVKAYSGNEVIVESRGGGGNHKRDRTMDGLKRLQIPGRGLEVTEEDNVVTVRTSPEGDGLAITVPVNTSLKLRSTNGRIEVQGVHGEIEASGQNGSVTLTNVAGTVVADSHNGAIKAVMDSVAAGKPISFSSWNGSVDVTLPADFKGNLKMKTTNGDIYTDFDIKLTPGAAVTEKSDSPNGRYRVKMDGTVNGTVNGGGTDATFTTYNGKVLLRKK